MTDKYTPYLTEHPEISVLLDGTAVDLQLAGDGEYVYLHLVDRFGATKWSSERLTLNELAHYEAKPSLWVERSGEEKHYLQYLRVLNGYSFGATKQIRMRSLLLNKRQTVFFSGKNAQIPLAVKYSRKRVRPAIIRWTKRVKVPQSSSLRPSPETIQKGYLDVQEIGSPSSYSLSVTPLSRPIYERTWTGVRTPGFGSLRKSQLPVNPHTVLVVETPTDVLVELNQTIEGPNVGNYDMKSSRGTLHYALPTLPDHLDQARNLAIRRLISNSQLGINANLAQDFAQLGQTLNLIGSTTRSISGSLRALKNGNIPKAIKTLWGSQPPRFRKGKRYQPTATNSVANNWLQMQYGWKPLLQDIHGALESLQSLTDSSDFIQSATASGTCDSVSDAAVPLWAEPGLGGGKEVSFVTTRCRIVLRYRIASQLKSYMAQTGFTNPVNLAWEILPFSFVADWFLPIGPFLETLSAWDGLEFVDGSQTLFTRSTQILAVNVTKRSNLNSFVLRSHRASRVRIMARLNRSKLTSFPTMTFPSFKNGLANVDHALNGLALLNQVFR